MSQALALHLPAPEQAYQRPPLRWIIRRARRIQARLRRAPPHGDLRCSPRLLRLRRPEPQAPAAGRSRRRSVSKGLTRDTAQLWAFLRADKGWWSVLRLTSHWAPTFTEREVEEHMETLSRGGFVISKDTERMGTVYAVTPACPPAARHNGAGAHATATERRCRAGAASSPRRDDHGLSHHADQLPPRCPGPPAPSQPDWRQALQP